MVSSTAHCPAHVQLLEDQPWTASGRRQQVLNFLQAKLEAEDEQLLLEGARVSTGTNSTCIQQSQGGSLQHRTISALDQQVQIQVQLASKYLGLLVWAMAGCSGQCQGILCNIHGHLVK